MCPSPLGPPETNANWFFDRHRSTSWYVSTPDGIVRADECTLVELSTSLGNYSAAEWYEFFEDQVASADMQLIGVLLRRLNGHRRKLPKDIIELLDDCFTEESLQARSDPVDDKIKKKEESES